MPPSSALENAWSDAKPQMESIRGQLASQTAPEARVIRVGQLDSDLLDQELVQLLKEPLNKTITLLNVDRISIEPVLYLV